MAVTPAELERLVRISSEPAALARLAAIAAGIAWPPPRKTESRGAGGRERTGPQADAARANAASGMERPAAAGRQETRPVQLIAGEMAPAGPAAPRARAQLALFGEVARG